MLGKKQRLGIGVKFSNTQIYFANSLAINFGATFLATAYFYIHVDIKEIDDLLITSHDFIFLSTPNDADL